MTQVDIVNFLSIVEIIGGVFIFCYGLFCLYFFDSLLAKYKFFFRIQVFLLTIINLTFQQNKIRFVWNAKHLNLLKL